MAEIHTFLGSNSPTGFLSLYGEFTDAFRDTLYIVKGFPGCGKSSFMRRIGNALQSAGADVEYIHCSGDPDSLDGVYFPQLAAAYADGTAPHVIEPRIPGAAETYINLAAFCRVSDLSPHRRTIAKLNGDYKKSYEKAYKYFFAAETARKAYFPEFDEGVISAVCRRAESAASRRLPDRKCGIGKVSRRFLRAYTCKGEVCFAETVSAMADEIIILDSALSLDAVFTHCAAEMICRRGWDSFHFISPDGERIEHIVIPEKRIAIVSGLDAALFPDKKCRHIRLDLIPDDAVRRPLIKKSRSALAVSRALRSEGTVHLAQAKALHDELEGYYIPHMDFEGIDLISERHITSLLELWTNLQNDGKMK